MEGDRDATTPPPGPERLRNDAQLDGALVASDGRALAHAVRSRGATQSDWNAHRETITYLYRDRQLPLHRVKEAMEREHGFFATERMYKHRFKQWRLAKYTKQQQQQQQKRRRRRRDDDDDTTASPLRPDDDADDDDDDDGRSVVVVVAPPLALPDGLRDLNACMSHLHCFVMATCGASGRRARRVDPSPEMALDRSSWCFAVNDAVLQIHQGRLAAGFGGLDAAFGRFRHSLAADDTGFLLRLVAALSLFADRGLPGLAAAFLRYARHALCIVLAPTHPFAIVARHLQAVLAARDASLDAVWDLLARYSRLLWRWSDPRPPPPPASGEPMPMLTELAWDLAFGADREFVLPLAAQAHAVPWAPSLFSVGMAVAQMHLTQRLYGAARRVLDGLRARLDPQAAPRDLALVYRKLWHTSRAEGHHAAACRDAHLLISFCRAALGPAHYITVRAADEYDEYLREWHARNPPDTTSEGPLLPDDATLDDGQEPGGLQDDPLASVVVLPRRSNIPLAEAEDLNA